MNYLALKFICAIQSIIGVLLIVSGGLFVAFVMFDHPDQDGSMLAALIGAGVAMLGVQIVAAAQVFQCLMQIEANTRKS